jgi:hypothetical protein
MCYWIIHLEKNKNGENRIFDLSSCPNGTAFSGSPIHINLERTIFIIWSDYGHKENGASYWIKLPGVLSIIKTNVKNKINIPYNVTSRNYDTETNILFNYYLISIFQKYITHVNFK